MVVSDLQVPDVTRNWTGIQVGSAGTYLECDYFREHLVHSKLGTASRLYGWTGLALCDSFHITNRAGSYSGIKGTPFMGKRTMEPH